MNTTLRRLPLLLAISAASCSGAQNPPPPVATPTPAGGADELRPLSSREAKAPAPAMGAATDTDRAPTLPPGHPPLGGEAMGAGPGPAGRSAGSVAGRITLSPSLEPSGAPSGVLYVMAKKGTATLAVRRVEKPSFPLDFEISGADAMVAGIAFEGKVDVVARLSRTGDAIPAKGDLEGTARNVTVPSKGVSVTIDRRRE